MYHICVSYQCLNVIWTRDPDRTSLFHPRSQTQGYSSPSDRVDHEAIEAHDNMLTFINYKGLYRRLDIISPPPDQWCVDMSGRPCVVSSSLS